MDRNWLHIAIIILVMGGLATYSQVIVAIPIGGTVIEGSAAIGVPENNLQVINQTSPKTIINWGSFNIAPHETVQFVQPSASAIALNRVVGSHHPSVILGTLKANGQIWLINPAGVLFGPTAKVDVAGLLATTADIRNRDFMAGRYQFARSPDRDASVINQGNITIREAGMAALVAPWVANHGVIEASLGTVVLASGSAYTVDLSGDGLFHFEIDPAWVIPLRPGGPESPALKDAVSNTGQIFADGGKVLLTAGQAKSIVENSINMTGIIRANTVVKKGGRVILRGDEKQGIVKVTGSIEARGLGEGDTGGSVAITGHRVGLIDGATIDVSGEAGGGWALVGGDFQGKGRRELPWADATFMGKDAIIRADALERGNGGTVVLWSENCTRFWGDISARGGKEGGNGGLVETSGHWVDPQGKIDASAPRGLGGKWLLDPYDVAIDAANTNGAFALAGGIETWTPSGNSSTVSNAVIQGFLNAGTSVLIRTSGGGGAQPGDITINSGFGISKTAGVPCTLTLQADRNILFRDQIADNGVSQLTLVLVVAGSVTQDPIVVDGFPAINVFALQLNVSGSFDIGFPGFHGNRVGTTSFVNTNTTGSNITLLNTFGSGTHFFNGNDLFQYLPVSSGGGIPSNVITSALNTSNFAPPETEFPVASSSTSLIEILPPSQLSAPLPADAAPPPSPPAAGAEASLAAPLAPEATAPPPAEAAGSEYGAGDIPIGGGIEGQEPVVTAEAAGGVEGIAEGAFAPEGIEGTEEVATPCPVNIEKSKTPIPPECPEKPKGPVNTDTLTDMELDPNSTLEKELKETPMGPNGINGIDVPIGADGIGGGDFGQEKIDTVEGAEGQEDMLEKYSWSPEDIDRSPEYREETAPASSMTKGG